MSSTTEERAQAMTDVTAAPLHNERAHSCANALSIIKQATRTRIAATKEEALFYCDNLIAYQSNSTKNYNI